MYMPTPSDRLRRALKAANLKATDAARRYGWSYNTLKSNLNGNAGYSYETAKTYARALKVNADWLFTGNGSMYPEPEPARDAYKVPLISWVAAGAMCDPGVADETIGEVTVGGLPMGDYFATEVRGDSMDRWSPHGSTVIVNCADKLVLPGRAYLFSLRGETTYKIYEREPVERLEPYSTNPNHRAIFLNGDRWDVIGRVVRTYYDLP